jgi:ribA/ribD-fused uncharacterized protein
MLSSFKNLVSTNKRQRGSSSGSDHTPVPKRHNISTGDKTHRIFEESFINLDISDTITDTTTEVAHPLTTDKTRTTSTDSFENYMDKVLSNQDLLDRLYERLDQKIDPLSDEQKKTAEKLDSLLESQKQLESEVKQAHALANEVQNEVSGLKNDMELLKNENKNLKAQMVETESYSKKYNLIFTGVRQSANENFDTLKMEMCLVFQSLGLDLRRFNLDNMHRLPSGSVIVKFTSCLDRDYVWSHRRNLAGTNPPLFMREHFPKEVEEHRRTLLPIQQTAVCNNIRASLHGDKLKVNGKTYTMDTIQLLPECLQAHKVGTREVGDNTFFYSGANFMSNFSPSKFKVDGKVYVDSEQFIQEKKCLLSNHPEKAQLVMETNDPRKMKAIAQSKNLPGFDVGKWNETLELIGFQAVSHKFRQNPELAQLLLNTGKKVLVEAAPHDKKWGIGFSIKTKDIMKHYDQWGENTHGKNLMKIRDILSAEQQQQQQQQKKDTPS